MPYKGLAPAITDLLGGQLQILFADVGLVAPQLKTGKLKGLAVTGATRSSVVPELPTMIEAGVPGYQAGTWYGVLAPAGTPAAVVARLNAELQKIVARAGDENAARRAGHRAGGWCAEQFSALIRDDLAKWGKVIRDAGIKLE